MNAPMDFVIVLAGIAVFAGGWLAWQLLRQNGRILLRLDELEQRLDERELGGDAEPEGLPLGSEAPAFELSGLTGERKSLAQFRGQRVLLIFFNPACGFCREMLPRLKEIVEARKQEADKDGTVIGNGTSRESPGIVVISAGDAGATRQLFDGHEVNCPVLLQQETEVAAARDN